MKTNNLKDLRPEVLGLPSHVGTYRPSNVKPATYGFTLKTAKNAIKQRYEEAISHQKAIVDEAFTSLYGKPLYFSERITSTLVARIKEIMGETGKSLKEIGMDFKAYLGEDCSFFRKVGDKQIPCDSQRIMDAYKQIQAGAPVEQIKAILYN